MKNHTRLIPVFLALLFLLGSCADMLNPPDGGGPVSPGKGRLAVQIEGAARTVLPAGVFDKYVLRFEYGGAEGYTHDDTEWSAGLDVDLEPGSWTVHADVYSGGTVVGAGSAAVTVSAGIVTPVTIRITVVKTGTGIKGTLRYKISYPADSAGHIYTMPDDLKAIDIESWINLTGTPITMPVTNGAEGTQELDAGIYLVYVHIADTLRTTEVIRMITAHIYGGQDTVLEIEVGEDEFSATIPVTGTADFRIPPGVTVYSREVRAYSDSACTVLVETSELSEAGPAGFTVRVSPVLGPVYLRQELVVENGGVPLTLTGRPGDMDVSLSHIEASHFALDLNDVFYGVSTAGISNGTVTADPFAAMAGATITVTVTPDPGFILKTGSVKYNDGGADYPLAGSGDTYTFVMPAGDVTISAEFVVNLTRYVVEGGSGTGDGLSWENASGDLQKMMDELWELYDAGLYPGPFVVKMGVGTYRPKYKPNTDGTIDPSTPANDRDSVFILREGVEVRGGYPEAGGDDASRDPVLNETILSGDFDDDDAVSGSGSTLNITGNAENAYHVVLGVNIPPDSGTVLDGLTITGGNADDTTAVGILVGGETIDRYYGGGMYNVRSSPTLNSVAIKGNKALGGGGMYNENNSSPHLTGVVISNNDGGKAGGGMCNFTDSSPVLTNVTISGNKALISGDGHTGGGGMYNHTNSSPVLTNVTISGNSVAESGGGMYNHTNSSPVLTNVTVSGNTSAGRYGGGILNRLSSPVLTGVTISGNRATGSDGGGMYNYTNSSPVLINVTISGNTANGNGGGIDNDIGSSMLMINVAIFGNKATDDINNGKGGGIYNAGCSPVLINVTISGNFADGGGGMYNWGGSSPQIRNSIIWGNAATTDEGISNDSSTSVISYSIVQGSSGSGGTWVLTGNTDGGGNAADPGTGASDSPFENWKDPAAAPTVEGSYLLKNDSPAISVGSGGLYPDNANNSVFSGITLSDAAKAAINTALEKDLAGGVRVQGVAIDMGAYEKE
jgi:hypothetical protein